MNRRKLINFMMAVMITLTAIAFALFGEGVFRKIFAMPLAFALPGYAAMAAWFPKRLTRFPGNVLFILMLSICLTSLGGLVLNATPWGLNTQSWAALLGGWTLLHLVISLVHRQSDFVPSQENVKGVTLPIYQVVMIAAAIGISLLTVYFSREAASNQDRSDLTQLWMAKTNSDNLIHVAVRNNDLEALDYKLLVKDGDSVIEESFQLGINEVWEKDLQMANGAARAVTVYLSRLDQPHLVYRTTSLWLPDTE